MEVRIDRLRETFKLLQPVVPKKTALPVLQNVLIRDGKVTASDLELTVTIDLPEAGGECLIPYQPVQELLTYLPGNKLLSIEQSKKSLKLSWEGGKASYDTKEPKEYPPVPEVEEKVKGAVDGDNFLKVLKSMIVYCATDEKRPILTGITLSLGESIELASGDGFRMAYQVLSMPFPAEARVTIPANSIQVLSGLWDKIPPSVQLADSLVRQVTAKRMLELTFGDKKMAARFGRVTMVSNLIEGDAPNFSQLIPQDLPLKIRVFAPELERAVRRVKDIARDGKEIVLFTWTEDALTVSAKSVDKGSVEAVVPVQTEGGEGKVAINVSYLLDYLSGKEGLVSIGVKDTQSPVLFRHSNSPVVVIMPMFTESKK